MPWPCFIVKPTKRVHRSLRRYADTSRCPSMSGDHSYHDASVYLDEIEHDLGDHWGDCDYTFAHDDPRWPKTCACGYAFMPEDHWQANRCLIFEGVREGVTVSGCISYHVVPVLPPGAMLVFDANDEIARAHAHDKAPHVDGKAVAILLPGHTLWWVDGPSYRDGNPGSGWSREGVPPLITCSPSIDAVGYYHGHVTAGALTADSEHRKYDAQGKLIK